MDISATVSGIPAIVRVTYSHYTKPNPTSWASDWDYHGGWTVDWEILDRRGRPAPWLERKCDQAEKSRLEAVIFENLNSAGEEP